MASVIERLSRIPSEHAKTHDTPVSEMISCADGPSSSAGSGTTQMDHDENAAHEKIRHHYGEQPGNTAQRGILFALWKMLASTVLSFATRLRLI